MSRKLILYIGMSLDGFIAKKDDNIDFLSIVSTANEDFGYAKFLDTIDTVIWGRKTFDKVLSFGNGVPHKNKKVFVISRTRKGTVSHAQYHSNLIELVNSLKSKQGKDIYCDGGGEIVFELLQHRLFDQLVINIIPHLLGDGIRLFGDGNIEQAIQHLDTKIFPSGLVQLHYSIKKSTT